MTLFTVIAAYFFIGFVVACIATQIDYFPPVRDWDDFMTVLTAWFFVAVKAMVDLWSKLLATLDIRTENPTVFVKNLKNKLF